jgi:hypothetical protein
VFISSTSDLAAERDAVAAALHGLFDAYLYEQDHAQASSPEQRCRQMIHASDFFVGLVGERYGTPFPGAVEERSIVEWEFDVARARNDLPVMAFLKKLPDPEAIDPRQKRFVERVTGDFQHGLWYKAFASTAELVGLVTTSLTATLLEFWARLKESRHAELQPRLRLLATIAIVTIAVLVAVTVTPLGEQIFKRWLLALTAAAGGVVLLCLVLVLVELGGSRDNSAS